MISSKTLAKFSLIENRIVETSLIFFGLQIVAFWNVWQWTLIRFQTSGEEFWGIFALLAAAVFAFNSKAETDGKIEKPVYILAAVFALIYVFSFIFNAPFLVRAIAAILSVTVFLSGWRFGKIFHVGIFTLLSMALPIVASLNFFLGFPMRVIVGEAVELLLKIQGLAVFREGTSLRFGEQLIWIDAPCSGIKMLWFGIFLTAISICFYQLKNVKSLAALILAFVMILLGNIFRASALFYTESEIIKAPSWFHESVGVIVFAVTSLAIVWTVKKIAEVEWQK